MLILSCFFATPPKECSRTTGGTKACLRALRLRTDSSQSYTAFANCPALALRIDFWGTPSYFVPDFIHSTMATLLAASCFMKAFHPTLVCSMINPVLLTLYSRLCHAISSLRKIHFVALGSGETIEEQEPASGLAIQWLT